jgi:hypothetical protein
VAEKTIKEVASELSKDELRDLERNGRMKEVPDDAPSAPVETEPELQDPALDTLAACAVAEDEDDEADVTKLPAWARDAIPPDLKIPKGETVYVMRFLAPWTKSKTVDRTCVLWSLSIGDEKLANQRGGDNSQNTLLELAKQMVRAIDGHRIDYTGRKPEASIDKWWNDIGRKCRTLIVSTFIRMHSLSDDERAYFLAHCVAARTLFVGG